MTLRTTYTFVELELSPGAYDEIAHKLKTAGYDHCFNPANGNGAIDMHGLAVTRASEDNRIPVGSLYVGHNDAGEVVINHPDLKPDADGTGHIVFSPEQAFEFARLVYGNAMTCRRILNQKEAAHDRG
jgi:hypothetical protein